MNILFYSPVRLRNGGGCERWHCDITNSLIKQFGHKIEIATSNLGDNKWDAGYLQQQLQGVEYTHLLDWSLFGIIIPRPTSLLTLLQKFRQADAVHFIHGFAGQDLLILALKTLTRKKVIIGHHAPILHKIGFHNWYMQNISRRLLNLFDGHMTLNARDKKFLESKWHIKNVHFIPSGIRLESFLAVKRQVHKHLNFITVGIYRTQKGIDTLIKAIALFNKRTPKNKVIFRLAGGGELQDEVTMGVNQNSNFIDLGYVKYESMSKWYAASDVYLLSSREEPFGLVLIEAWASGMPVLATKTEGPMDMLLPNKNGWFIDNFTPEAMCFAIAKIYAIWLKNPEQLLLNEKICRATGQRYSIDTTASLMQKNFWMH